MGSGWFPKELPPAFTTDSLAKWVSVNASNLPDELTRRRPIQAALVTYNLARPGKLRRKLSIPNPIPFFHLASLIVDNKSKLFSLAETPLSCPSMPRVLRIPSAERAILPHGSSSKIQEERAHSRVGKGVLLRADISNFYGSIYTHAVDWAISGKAAAKRRQNDKNRLGAKIDACLMAMQNMQTRGIPVGPDTSLLIAHIVLSKVDRLLVRKVKSPSGFRYMDDYELTFSTRERAETALAVLEDSAAEFELDLNSDKTFIADLPILAEESPIQELQSFEFRAPRKGQTNSIVHFFNRALDLSIEFPNQPILRYAVGVIRNYKGVEIEDPKLLQTLILQAATTEPGVLPIAIPALLRIRNAATQLPKEPIADLISWTIERHAPKGHSSEVAYSLWASRAFEVAISEKSGNLVAKMKDDVCGLLLLDLRSRNLAKFGANAERNLLTMATRENLYGEHWLFAYEAVHKGWLGIRGGSYLPKEPFFRDLHKEKVSFFDASDALIMKVVEAETLLDY